MGSVERQARAKRRYELSVVFGGFLTLLAVLASLLFTVQQNQRISDIAEETREQAVRNEEVLEGLADLLEAQGENSEQARARLRQALRVLDERLDESDRSTIKAINDLIRAINRRNPESEPIPLIDFPKDTEPPQKRQNSGPTPRPKPGPSARPSPSPSASHRPHPQPSPSPCRVPNPLTGQCLLRSSS